LAATLSGRGSESADDVIVRIAREWEDAGRPCRLVTSDHDLRRRMGAAEVIGGGSLLRKLLAAERGADEHLSNSASPGSS